jgi:hypothetical protein
MIFRQHDEQKEKILTISGVSKGKKEDNNNLVVSLCPTKISSERKA